MLTPKLPIRRAALAACLLSTTIHSAGAAVLEEVIVTAQMRSQNLQDVPVSVSSVGGEKLIAAGIDKLEDLQAYVPNLTMSETGIGTVIYVRGIGSGINQGFEQSVGMYVDGVYYGRAQLSRAPFLDLERVEVLRGPQNILHGKNSIAGALSINTRKPSEEFEASVAGVYEPEHGEEVIDLVLSAPLTEDISFRFASRLRRMDGYMENLTLNRNEPEREELSLRGSLQWELNDRWTANAKIETGQFDVTGRQVEIVNDQPAVSDLPFFDGRRYSEILDRTEFPPGGGVFPGPTIDIDEDSSVLNIEQDYKRSSNGDFSNNETQNLTLRFDYGGENGDWSFITSYLAYEFEELCDCDFTGARVFNLSLAEDYSQFSQELRWLSPTGGRFETIAGAYFQYNRLPFQDSIIVDSDVVPQLLNAADFVEGGARGDNDPRASSDPFEAAGIGDAGTAVQNLTSPRDFRGETSTFSVFSQVTWNVDDFWRVTVGARYTHERKTGSRVLDFADLEGNRRPIGEVDTVSAVTFGSERHDLSGERIENQISPLLNIQWDATENLMAYLTATRGFKSGGYDARSNASPSAEPTPANPDAAPGGANQQVLIGTFEYEEEQATSLELGAKMTLLEGAGELNIALFLTEYENLQVSIFDGTLGFNVGNAASAETMGLELDGRLALSETLMLTAALSLLDFEFKEFQNGQCYQGQTPDSPDGRNCIYDGKTNQYVADFAGNISLAWRSPISDSLMATATIDALFTDDFNPTQNLDPALEQDGHVKFNARLGLSAIDEKWDLALVGKNLTDEAVITYANDTPTSFSVYGSIGHYAFMERPRSIALQWRYRW